MRKILFILLFASGLFAQVGVFTSFADTTRLSNSTEVEGELIYYNANWEGSATLFVTGASISGTASSITVKYVLYLGKAADGASLYSEKFTLGTVATSFLGESFGDGSYTGETFIMGNDAEWTDASGVTFYFIGTGTQETDLLAVFKQGK